MKKVFGIFATLVALFTLVACGGNSGLVSQAEQTYNETYNEYVDSNHEFDYSPYKDPKITVDVDDSMNRVTVNYKVKSDADITLAEEIAKDATDSFINTLDSEYKDYQVYYNVTE
jgi:hypothetical protein